MLESVLHGIGKPIEIEGPHPGEVRIEVAASDICRSDRSATACVLNSPLPVVLGREEAGIAAPR